MRSRVRAALIAAAIAGTVIPGVAGAQSVRGTVRDSASRDPLGGAVVTLTDSAGKFLARSLSDAQGRFAVLRVLGATRLHVVRIGFRPWDGTLGDPSADSAIAVRMQQVPVMLGSVTSTEERVCPGHAPESRALDMWEQARAALLSIVVGREAHAPRVRLLSFERTRDPVLKQVTSDSVSLKNMVVDRSYVAARPAWVLASQGYVRERGGGEREYFAPDETVLLDTTFAETHCLSLEQGEGLHQEELGIRFDALRGPGRDTIVDIDGVLWIDKLHPQLRSLQYRYTSLEPAAKDAGGEVYFSTMPSGAPMITQWTIHSPILATEQAMSPNGVTTHSVPRKDRTTARVLEYQETGGTLVAADWDNGLHWHGAFPRAVGTVVDSAKVPVPGIRVWLESTGDTVSTDASGHFVLPYVLPGIYVLSASDSVLAGAGVARVVPQTIAMTRAAEYEARVVLHSRAEVLALACPANSYRPGTGAIFARVVDSTGSPVGDAQIDVAALQQIVANDTVSRAVMRSGKSGADGRFVICGADLHQPLGIQAIKGGHAATAIIRTWGDGVIALRLVMDQDQR